MNEYDFEYMKLSKEYNKALENGDYCGAVEALSGMMEICLAEKRPRDYETMRSVLDELESIL